MFWEAFWYDLFCFYLCLFSTLIHFFIKIFFSKCSFISCNTSLLWVDFIFSLCTWSISFKLMGSFKYVVIFSSLLFRSEPLKSWLKPSMQRWYLTNEKINRRVIKNASSSCFIGRQTTLRIYRLFPLG